MTFKELIYLDFRFKLILFAILIINPSKKLYNLKQTK